MASLGIRCGGNCGVLDRPYVNVHDGCCDQKAGPRSLVVPTGSGARWRRSRRFVSAMTSLQPVNRRGNGNEVISRDKLDEWMKESVVDIVKNLREAPLFLRFYTTEDGEAARFETEKAVEEKRWPVLEEQWKNGAAPMPEGILFVQELEDDDYDEDADGGGGNGSNIAGESKAWGIVIQGRGVERGGPVCYLLKTSSAAGLGLWCTHFCLVRVKNFRETTKSQLENCWLLQNQ
ncbi:uncharacterized protein LOC111006084 [Momordica charantia]|uniref:Uncharacterized protein LOC111006084 n=1 Tax=Momordica charantia TaxID=3673 RepID=A0A6J1BZC8_MOMCH|nr:uncharacterized protein LOC111006084 [Momordica charantia]